ncbi:MAG: CYTH domain-containing protein [Tissierellia bacterium]|nr:CYTH domain-containing protein [Tissierellia bacterium]
MERELEVKILGYTLDAYETMVKSLGATYLSTEEQVVYWFKDAPVGENGYLRLRLIDGQATFTYKERVDHQGIRENIERNVTISEPQTFLEILEILGYKPIVQRKIRRKYTWNHFIFDIDQWDPRVYPHPYMEIEAPDQEEMNEILKKLQIPKDKISLLSIKELIAGEENRK